MMDEAPEYMLTEEPKAETKEAYLKRRLDLIVRREAADKKVVQTDPGIKHMRVEVYARPIT